MSKKKKTQETTQAQPTTQIQVKETKVPELGISLLNIDQSEYWSGINKSVESCHGFKADVFTTITYDGETYPSENPDIYKGAKYMFLHYVITPKDIRIQTRDTSFVDISRLVEYGEESIVLIKKENLNVAGFQRLLRDRIINNLFFLNTSHFKCDTDVKKIKAYRDLMTLVEFCNKYKKYLSSYDKTKSDEYLSKVFLNEHILFYTIADNNEYKFELIELSLRENSYDIFNLNADRKALGLKTYEERITDFMTQFEDDTDTTDNTTSATLEITTQEEALVKDSLSDISDKLCYYTNKLKKGIYPLPTEAIVTDIKNMAATLCSIINKYKDYSSELGQNFYKIAYAMLHALKVVSYAYGKPIICEAFDKTVSFTIEY
jgi:hypothetical protein